VHSKLLTLSRAALVTITISLVACSDPAGDTLLGTSSEAIVNGELSDESEDEVVDLYGRVSPDAVIHCSGTLIAPDVVLTALHCVTSRDDPNASFRCDPDGTLTSTTPGAGTLGATIDPVEVEVFIGATHDSEPDAYGAEIFGSGSTQICRGDMAAVVLDRELLDDVASVRFGRSVTLGERMRVVGYGLAEVSAEVNRRYRAGRRVIDIGAVGDDPGTGTTAPNTFVVGEGPCHGDSGGPAFSEETGAITGIYSLSAAATCTAVGVRNTFTLLSPYESVVRQALESVGRDPIVEEDPTPDAGTGGSSGTAGTGGSESGSGGTTGGSDSGGSSGSSGTAGDAGEQGGRRGEGSGSRSSGCACYTAGGAARSAAGWAALGVLAFAVARRRKTRSA
jgi:MYXO-CTERM domain-containing protein